MDEVRLLELLEADGRVSARDLATMLGTTEAKVEKAISDLKRRGVIKGYAGVVDWRRLHSGRATAVIQVKVVPQRRTGFDKVCSDISKDRRVCDVFITSGKYDLMVTVRAENVDEVSAFVTDKLAPMKEVVGTYTHIILKEFKRDGHVFHKAKRKRLPVS